MGRIRLSLYTILLIAVAVVLVLFDSWFLMTMVQNGAKKTYTNFTEEINRELENLYGITLSQDVQPIVLVDRSDYLQPSPYMDLYLRIPEEQAERFLTEHGNQNAQRSNNHYAHYDLGYIKDHLQGKKRITLSANRNQSTALSEALEQSNSAPFSFAWWVLWGIIQLVCIISFGFMVRKIKRPLESRKGNTELIGLNGV
ncbi:MAG: hypothetical protein HFE39_09710 [Clostridiales bacterium]|jgi:hypothetical protein|nr:hypothetical protein [Clostridiales bacterium]